MRLLPSLPTRATIEVTLFAEILIPKSQTCCLLVTAKLSIAYLAHGMVDRMKLLFSSEISFRVKHGAPQVRSPDKTWCISIVAFVVNIRFDDDLLLSLGIFSPLQVYTIGVHRGLLPLF